MSKSLREALTTIGDPSSDQCTNNDKPLPPSGEARALVILWACLGTPGGFQERAALWAAVFAAALSMPLGTLTSFPIISRIDQTVLAALLALSGGALIYVGASHILPAAEREPRRYNLLALGAGVLVALGIVAAHQ